jgi:hypothetical protein
MKKFLLDLSKMHIKKVANTIMLGGTFFIDNVTKSGKHCLKEACVYVPSLFNLIRF